MTASTARVACCWAAEWEPESGTHALREAGIEAIELWPGHVRRWGVVRWQAALNAAGMQVAQLCPYFDVVHGPVGIELGRSAMYEWLAIAAALGCRRLRTFTGPPWGPHRIGAAQADDATWSEAAAALAEYADLAASQQVELCLECHEGSLMEDSLSTARLLALVDRPNLTINLQLPLLDESWQVSVAALGARTTHIHIHNWTEGLGQGELTGIGDGAFDWLPVLRKIQRLGGRPVLSLEHPDHGGRDDPLRTAQRDAPVLHRLIAECT